MQTGLAKEERSDVEWWEKYENLGLFNGLIENKLGH
jgi:hypothetical protein